MLQCVQCAHMRAFECMHQKQRHGSNRPELAAQMHATKCRAFHFQNNANIEIISRPIVGFGCKTNNNR